MAKPVVSLVVDGDAELVWLVKARVGAFIELSQLLKLCISSDDHLLLSLKTCNRF